MRIAVIGVGVMGELISRSLLERNILNEKQLVVAEQRSKRREELAAKYNYQIVADAPSAVVGADLVILCVKPQAAEETMASLKAKIKPQALVVSIMAGIKLKTLQKALDHKNIVRSMPNISSQIGMGMTVWMADRDIPDIELLLAKVVFQSFGKEMRVDTDEGIDAATAVSGTGPAYIFYIAEKLICASNDLGFTDEQSKVLVNHTFLGAMEMWQRTGYEPERLRKMVSSRKGTTEAAIKRFEELNTGGVFKEAVKAAFKRAQELGEQVNSH